jgi:hypothetical protein
MQLLCTSPSGGIGVATGPSTPTPSAAVMPITRVDENGNKVVFDNALVFNIDRMNAVPASVLCQLAVTPAGHYYVVSAPGWSPFASVGPNGILNQTTGQSPPPWIGPVPF